MLAIKVADVEGVALIVFDVCNYTRCWRRCWSLGLSWGVSGGKRLGWRGTRTSRHRHPDGEQGPEQFRCAHGGFLWMGLGEVALSSRKAGDGLNARGFPTPKKGVRLLSGAPRSGADWVGRE